MAPPTASGRHGGSARGLLTPRRDTSRRDTSRRDTSRRDGARSAASPRIPQGGQARGAVGLVRAVPVVALALLLAAGSAGLLALAATLPVTAPAGTAALDAVLARLAAGAAGLVAAWWALGLLACVAAALRGLSPSSLTARLARSLPRPLQLVAGATLGVALTAGTLPAALAEPGPATAAVELASSLEPEWLPTLAAIPDVAPRSAAAAEGASGRSAPASAAGVAAVADPGWAPTRPSAPPHPAQSPEALLPALRAETATAEEVVVHRGDTLWTIAARYLPAGATDAEIAAEWPRWYDANRDVLGDDPDHIEPGQLLSPPTADQASGT